MSVNIDVNNSVMVTMVTTIHASQSVSEIKEIFGEKSKVRLAASSSDQP